MARWKTTAVQLTANQVAGIDPVVADENGPGTMRRLVAVQSRSAGAIELGMGAAPALGQGIPVAAAGLFPVPAGGDVTFNGALYVLGGSAGEYIVLIWA